MCCQNYFLGKKTKNENQEKRCANETNPKTIYRFCTKILIKQILCVKRKLSVKAGKFSSAQSATSLAPPLLWPDVLALRYRPFSPSAGRKLARETPAWTRLGSRSSLSASWVPNSIQFLHHKLCSKYQKTCSIIWPKEININIAEDSRILYVGNVGRKFGIFLFFVFIGHPKTMQPQKCLTLDGDSVWDLGRGCQPA